MFEEITQVLGDDYIWVYRHEGAADVVGMLGSTIHTGKMVTNVMGGSFMLK